jgi:hypothetical protein
MSGTAQQPGACTSPPAEELKEFNGVIAALDFDKRILTMHDEHGVTHPFKWSNDAQDEFFRKQKPGYGLTLKYDDETRVLKGAAFWRKPEGFGKKGAGQNWQPKKPRVTIAATVNLQNYENIKVEVEGNSAEECTKILIDTLNGFAKNPAYAATRDMIQSYAARVLNAKIGDA